ncbi:MAG: hypothetical protein AAF804_07525, partial [Bacteroidota bacterium]
MYPYAEVILPLAVKSNFHYRLRPSQIGQVAPGMRVLVSFGKSRLYTGMVKRMWEELPEDVVADRLKYIEEVLDEAPLLTSVHLKLYEWVAYYYLCTQGEAFKSALPAGLKPESSLRVEMREGLAWEDLELDEKEYLLLEALSIQPVLTLPEICGIWNISHVTPRLKSMEARGLIQSYQQVDEKYKVKTKTYLRLHPQCQSEEALHAAFDALESAPSQLDLLMRVVQAYYQDQLLPQAETLKELGQGAGTVKALMKKGYLEREEVKVDR